MAQKLGAGVLPAAVRQGASEIGQALKAFPDAIQVTEPGQMFTPTQGEIAEARRERSLESRVQKNLEQAADRTEREQQLERD